MEKQAEDTREEGRKEAPGKVRFVWVLAFTPIALVLLFILLHLLGPSIPCLRSWVMHTDPTNWRFSYAKLLPATQDHPAALLLFMWNEPPGYGSAYNRLLTLAADDGRSLGQYIDNNDISLLGMDRKRIWIKREWGGDLVLGLSLPDLEESIDLTARIEQLPQLRGIVKGVSVDGSEGLLHIEARDGYCYSLEPDLGELKRMDRDHPPLRPNLLQEDWQSPSVPDELLPPGHQIHFAGAQGDLGIFVSGEQEDPDDLQVTAFDTKSGRLRWSRVFW